MEKRAEKEGYLDTIFKYMENAPVDVRALAFDLGIKVVDKDLEDATSGSIEKKDGQYVITVNMNHSENRKRFTIAHELGHFLMHDDIIDDGIFDNKLYRSTEGRHNQFISQIHETQANKFAASVLMPKTLIQKLIADGINDASQLASILGVSEHAMRIRLDNLPEADAA